MGCPRLVLQNSALPSLNAMVTNGPFSISENHILGSDFEPIEFQ